MFRDNYGAFTLLHHTLHRLSLLIAAVLICAACQTSTSSRQTSSPGVPSAQATHAPAIQPDIAQTPARCEPSPVPAHLACVTAADCVISCEDECCPSCGCKGVMNRTSLEEFTRMRSQRCTREVIATCPHLACRLEVPTLEIPLCDQGRCRLASTLRTTAPSSQPIPVPAPEKIPPKTHDPSISPEKHDATPGGRAVYQKPMVTHMPPWPGPPPDIPATHACASSADCTLSCEGCCGAPCGCNNAVNLAAAQQERESRVDRCASFDTSRCPAVACAWQDYMAFCRNGRCIAAGGRSLFEPELETEGRNAPATGYSSLQGVSIVFPPQPLQYTRAELAAGVTLRWVVLVDGPEGGSLVPELTPNGCGAPGATGLVSHAVVRSKTQRFCNCDTGLCAPRDATTLLRPGRDEGTLFWDGASGEGPSDFNAPQGPPFTPGVVFLEVASRGTFEGQPFAVTATLMLQVLP